MSQGPTDEQWTSLLDEKQINARRDQAERRFRDLTSSDILRLRRRAKVDGLFLAGLLEYDRMTPSLHGHYFQWLREQWGQQYRLTLFPRDHYKSTGNTVTDSVQMALPDDVGLGIHPYSLGPNIKILLSHENRESASRFLFEVTAAFVAKPAIMALYPELIPQSRVQRMNRFELELPRQEHHKEPTFDTLGAGGAAQGRHYNWLKLDDLIGEDARDSATVMKRIFNWFDNVISLLTLPKIDGFDLTGTFWGDADLYGHAIEVYGINKERSIIRALDEDQIAELPDGELVAYWRGILEDDKPIFPELISPEIIARLRKNPVVFASQYANNPRRSELQEFDFRWLRYYNHGARDILYVFAGEDTWKVHLWSLDRVIMIDPSPGEAEQGEPSGIVVTGTDEKLNIYVLETIKKRMKPPELIDEMFRLWQKWHPRVISIEEVNFSNTYRHWFYERAERIGVYPTVEPAKVGTRKSKDSRIRALSNYMGAGQFFILEGMHTLRDEIERFPLGRDKHLLDALAQGPQIWAPGLREEDMRRNREVEEAVIGRRSARTGY